MMFLSYTILFLAVGNADHLGKYHQCRIDLEVLHLMGPVKFALTGMM